MSIENNAAVHDGRVGAVVAEFVVRYDGPGVEPWVLVRFIQRHPAAVSVDRRVCRAVEHVRTPYRARHGITRRAGRTARSKRVMLGTCGTWSGTAKAGEVGCHQ